MARPCPSCLAIDIGDQVDVCDVCDADLRYRACYCSHSKDGGCICDDVCPAYASCPAWNAHLWDDPSDRDPPEPVTRSSPVNPPEGRAERAQG
jgi:hypothetical protein